MENKKRLIWILVAGIILIESVYFILQTITLSSDLSIAESTITTFNQNQKVLNFTSLFINKVLESNKEIDFDTRLMLENAVRDLRDPEILAQWQKFVGSKTEATAQVEVKNLLGLLVEKIK